MSTWFRSLSEIWKKF